MNTKYLRFEGSIGFIEKWLKYLKESAFCAVLLLLVGTCMFVLWGGSLSNEVVAFWGGLGWRKMIILTEVIYFWRVEFWFVNVLNFGGRGVLRMY